MIKDVRETVKRAIAAEVALTARERDIAEWTERFNAVVARTDVRANWAKPAYSALLTRDLDLGSNVHVRTCRQDAARADAR